MAYLISPKVDFVFKRIFGNENHPNILISFLNAVMKPKHLIKSVEIRNSDIEKEYIEDKYSRLDIKAVTDSGEHINIEIQVKNEYNMIQRSLYYWSKMYESQIVKGEDYSKLAKTVCINILDFKYLKTESYHSAYRLKDIVSNEELTDIMEIHFIEIPKLKRLKNTEEITDILEAWIMFIADPDSKVVEQLEMTQKEIKEAKEELKRMSLSSKDRELYEKRTESILEKNSLFAGAEKKGREMEKKERDNKLVKNAVQNNLDDETISKVTGLTIEEIQNIKKLI